MEIVERTIMIKYFYVNNYKSFVNFKVEFDKIALLLGKNGSGKSNLFEVVSKLCRFINGDDATTVDKIFSYNSLTRWMKSNIQTFEFCIEEDQNEYIYSLEVIYSNTTYKCSINSEKITRNGSVLMTVADGIVTINDDMSLKSMGFLTGKEYSSIRFAPDDEQHKFIRDFKSFIRRIIICTPDPKGMLSLVGDDSDRLEPDFSNIGSVCADLLQTLPEAFVELNSVMKEINPSYVMARIVPGAYNKSLCIEYLYKDVKCVFDFNDLSDGEKTIFSLYLLIFAYLKNGFTLLMDEPDNYISLREIQAICMTIEEKVQDNGQCILISHNGDVINYFTDQAGIWFERNTSGESRIIDNPYYRDKEEVIMPYSEMISRGIGEMDEA